MLYSQKLENTRYPVYAEPRLDIFDLLQIAIILRLAIYCSCAIRDIYYY
jgi:hypothetical protein